MIRDKLKQLKDQSSYRSLTLGSGLDLSSNDYLGLAADGCLKQAAMQGLEEGIRLGATGSRLLRGHTRDHQNLEEFAAAHYGFEKSLYFASGFQANYALLTTLPTRHDVVLYDSLVHASVLDGLHAAHARRHKIRHNDLDDYEGTLKKIRHSTFKGHIFIAVESLYSMDGDFAPLPALADLAGRYDATLIIDEAHTTGVWGVGGRGLSFDLPNKHRIITLHTCGKALGSAGGLICASSDIIDYLINTARPFIYSTAPSPLQAYVTHQAIKISAGAEGDKRRHILKDLCTYAEDQIGGHGSQIIPVIMGDNATAIRAAHNLQKDGFDIRAIRPPTVPKGSARLRLSLNAKIDKQTLHTVLEKIQTLRV